MKKIIFINLVFAAVAVPGQAQNAGHFAERYRSLVNTNAFYEKTFNSINKQTIMKKTIFMALTTLTTVFASAQTDKKDEQAIRSIVSSMQKGWNEKSGKTFASGFAKVHDYIVINGMFLSSITPDVNANAHQGIFNSIYKTTDLEVRIDKISFIRPDLAIVHVLGATYEHGASIPENPGSVISMVVEKKENEWKIISFHNCDIEVSFDPADAAKSPVPLKVMYAGWYKK